MQRGIVSSDIYKILAAPSYGFEITMYDSDGNGTISPIVAKWMYIKPVNFMIQVPNGSDSTIRPEVYLWKSKDINDEDTKQILSRLKNCTNQYGYGFTINDFGSGNLPKKFSHIAQRNVEEKNLNESVNKLKGSSLRSYYVLPKAKAIIVHTSKIDENDRSARTKNVKDIFIESNGERIRLKTPNIDSAKALTVHLNENGSLNDSFGTYIKNSAQDLMDLEASANDFDNSKVMHKQKALYFIQELKKMLKSASTNKGYANILCTQQPRVGKKYIQDFSSRLGVKSDALARQFLINECRNLEKYSTVIFENYLSGELESKDAIKLAKKVCLGCLDVDNSDNSKRELQIPYSDGEQKVLLFGDAIAKVLTDAIIREVLENITNKPSITEDDARFISAVGNSIVGRFKPSFILGVTGVDGENSVANTDSGEGTSEALVEEIPELDELKEWIEKNS